jgi:hypothetical protein
MVKPVTMQIIGITTTSLPDGQPFIAYSAFIDAGGVTNPIFALESGTLPAGLAFDTLSGEIFGTPIQAEIQPLVFSVTEAGTGITCVADPITLEIVGPSDCENTPTNSVTHNDTVGFYNSLAIVPNDKYLLACEGFTPSMELFDVSGGTIVSVTTQTRTSASVGSLESACQRVGSRRSGCWHANPSLVHVITAKRLWFKRGRINLQMPSEPMFFSNGLLFVLRQPEGFSQSAEMEESR